MTHSGFDQTTAMNRKRRNSLAAFATAMQITKPVIPKWDLSCKTPRDSFTLVSPVIYGVFILTMGLFTISMENLYHSEGPSLNKFSDVSRISLFKINPLHLSITHLSKGTSGLKQKCLLTLTSFLGTVFHALLHGEIHFVPSVSFKKL